MIALTALNRWIVKPVQKFLLDRADMLIIQTAPNRMNKSPCRPLLRTAKMMPAINMSPPPIPENTATYRSGTNGQNKILDNRFVRDVPNDPRVARMAALRAAVLM